MAYWLDPNADNKGNCKSYICDYVSDIALLPRFNVKGADTDSIDVASQQPCSYGSTCVCIENGSAYMLTKDTNEWRAMSVSDSGGGSSSQDVSELRNRIENIETALDGHTIGTDVPADAKFTDTVYDDTAVKTDISANTEAINQNKTDISKVDEKVENLKAQGVQQTPLFAENVEWLEENGDTSKVYVLPDGYIYGYMLTEISTEEKPNFTNKLPLAINSDGSEYIGDNGEDGYKTGYRVSSSGVEKVAAGYDCTGFIPAVKGDTIRIKNIAEITTENDPNAYATAYFFKSDYTRSTPSVLYMNRDAQNENSIYTLTVPSYDDIVYFRITLMGTNVDTIITVNEEITYTAGGTTTGYGWANTGHLFISDGYGNTDVDALELIKKWDAPIYDANIPVFELSVEKNAITSAEKTVSAVYAKYDALMANHPQYITRTDLGMCSDGVTPVYRYDFREPEPHRGTTGKKEWSETKSKAVIVSGIHWEWGGIFSLYNALEEIAENPNLYNLRRNTHLIVLPVCNPYAVANNSVRNANLVEIHRNFEVDFIYPGEPGYIEIGERSHGGTEPLSEVETQYIDNIMKENTDAAFFLTCHSYQTDSIWGTGFTWASPATYYMCNMHYRVIDKLSKSWINRFGETLLRGIEEYKTENLADGDTRFGSAYLSTTNGTETKQATKYGIQAVNVEVCDTFWAHGTKANPEANLSSFTMSRGAETYINFLLTAFGCYDPKDKALYTT